MGYALLGFAVGVYIGIAIMCWCNDQKSMNEEN